MSWRASDFPDEQAAPPLRGAPSGGDDFDHLSDWPPERLPTFNWRKVVLLGTTVTLLSGAGIWLVKANTSGAQTLVADPSPQTAGPGEESTPAQPFPGTGSGAAVGRDPMPSTPSLEDGAKDTRSAGRKDDPSARSRQIAVSPTDGARPEADPSQLTVKQAYRIHGRYQKGLSAAQAGLDQAAMGKLEAGLAVEMTRAGFKTARMQGESVASGIWPNPRVWVPRHVEGRADWFVAMSYEPGVARVVDVMSSTPAGWRLVTSAADTRATPARFPAIATDSGGYATSLPEDAPGLLATPRQIARAHLAALESAKPDPRFEEGPWTSEAVEFWRQERAQLEQAGWILSLSYRPAGPLLALKTQDGGALVWYGARSTEARMAERAGAKVRLKGSAAVRTGNRAFAHSVSATYGRMYVTYVPPAGSTEPARVLGEWSDVLESHGD
ncbi:hypothetical protein GCM10017673_11060 [Streptosporangium violaceochromogenes]|nr:hypothetical protein GCM10017673_11060 [Streptosporangium violaceochromogenes]